MRKLLLVVYREVLSFTCDNNGQAIVWVAVMLPLFLAVVGLSIDGGLVFDARRELQNVADAAARAGAMQIDERVYRESFGQRVVLDPTTARAVAMDYIQIQPGHVSATVTADTQAVVVDVERNVSTSFLRLLGIATARVTATAVAEVRHGIERGER